MVGVCGKTDADGDGNEDGVTDAVSVTVANVGADFGWNTYVYNTKAAIKPNIVIVMARSENIGFSKNK